MPPSSPPSLLDLRESLGVLLPGSGSCLQWLMPALQRVIPRSRTASYGLVRGPSGYEVSFFEQAGNSPQVVPRIREAYARGIMRPLFDPAGPARRLRNRVQSLSELLRTAEDRTQAQQNLRFLHDEGIVSRDDDQLRVLVCDGPTLHGLLAVVREGSFSAGERRDFQELVPAVAHRLSLERLLEGAPLASSLLHAALGSMAAPAFLVTRAGRIVHANEAGLAYMRLAETRKLLADASHGRPTAVPVRLIGIEEQGLPRYSLAVVKLPRSVIGRARSSARRWRLSPRQAEVLELLARGLSNHTIAGFIGAAERTVEAHVSAILVAAGAESRASVIAQVWGAPEEDDT